MNQTHPKIDRKINKGAEARRPGGPGKRRTSETRGRPGPGPQVFHRHRWCAGGPGPGLRGGGHRGGGRARRARPRQARQDPSQAHNGGARDRDPGRLRAERGGPRDPGERQGQEVPYRHTATLPPHPLRSRRSAPTLGARPRRPTWPPPRTT